MAAVRYLHRLVLALWLGSIFFFAAAVAPALFRALTPAESGTVVRQLIPFIDVFGLVAGPVLIGLGAVAEGSIRGRGAARGALLLGMSLLAAASFFFITPRLENLRAQAGASLSALAPDHPVRREFGALHGVSTGLMLGEAVFGLVALGLGLRPRG